MITRIFTKTTGDFLIIEEDDAGQRYQAPELLLAGVAAEHRSPHWIGRSSVILGNFGMHLAACNNMRAPELSHHHRVTAIGPPIERMVNRIHPSMLTTHAMNRKTQACSRDDQGSIVSPATSFELCRDP